MPKADLDRFFARVHTPVQPTPEEEERALRPRRRALRGGRRGAQAPARLELGDHEAQARRRPRLRRLLGPRRPGHPAALGRRQHPSNG
ncbi:MAG: hypothetical protein M0C28_40510 [Candidatus Moduliflexus flocculans]|nr:hypothetical protein [Candidatus Moduliflexus flocculans]